MGALFFDYRNRSHMSRMEAMSDVLSFNLLFFHCLNGLVLVDNNFF